MFKNKTRKYKVRSFDNTKLDENQKNLFFLSNNTTNWSQKIPIQNYTDKIYTENLKSSEWKPETYIQNQNNIYKPYNYEEEQRRKNAEEEQRRKNAEDEKNRINLNNLVNGIYSGANNSTTLIELAKNIPELNKEDTRYHITPLGAAILEGDRSLAEELIRLGANIHYPDEGERLLKTIFSWRLDSKSSDIINFILKKGISKERIDPFLTNEFTKVMSYESLKESSDYKTVKNRIEEKLYLPYYDFPIDTLSTKKLSLVGNFILDDKFEMADQLVRLGADIGYPDNGYTLLKTIFTLRYTTYSKKLLLRLNYLNKKGISINLKNKDGNTLLLEFIKEKKAISLIEMLLMCKPDPNIKDINGNTALDLAIQQGNTQLIDVLVSYGAEFDSHQLSSSTQAVANKIHTQESGQLQLYEGNPTAKKQLLSEAYIFVGNEIECLDNLEVLHQHTGQCWNDASIIFLWFASGAGKYVQHELLNKSVESMFASWIKKEEIERQIGDLFPSISKKNIQMLVDALVDYVGSMEDRFSLLKTYAKKNKYTPQRFMSQACSITGEESGIRASNILSNPGFAPNTIDSLRGYLKEYIQTKIQPKYLEEKLRKNGKGYSNNLFSSVLYILLQYFLKGNILMYMIDSLNERDSMSLLKNILNEYASPIFIYNHFWQITYRETIIDIIATFPTYHISAICNVKVINKENSSGHALSFITCENGEQYFYDDNNYKLESIHWYLLFEGVDKKREMDILMYPYGYDFTKSFLGVNLENYKSQTSNLMFIQVIFPKERTDNNIGDIECFVITNEGRSNKLPINRSVVNTLLGDYKRLLVWSNYNLSTIMTMLVKGQPIGYYNFSFASLLVHNPKNQTDTTVSKDNFRVLLENKNSFISKREVLASYKRTAGGSRKRKQAQKRKTRKH